MAQRPHVLLVICDQMQNQRLGVVDPVAFTPALDRLAGEGVRFSHVYCSNPQCVPSRVSLQTGLYPHEAGVMIIYGFHGHTAHLTGEQPTVGQALRDAGHTTAYFGKTHFGADLGRLGYDHSGQEGVPGGNPAKDRAYTDQALDFLSGHDPRQPLFLTLSLHSPHPAFELVEAFAAHYPLERMQLAESYYRDDLASKPAFQRQHALDGRHGTGTEGALREELRRYYTMISHVDHLFGELRAAFEARGMWDDAVVLFTSDHGDMMGAHGTRLKGTLPYEELYRVPCLLRLPGDRHAARVIEDLASNTAVPGTLLEAAGLPVPAAFRGGSLLPLLEGPGAPPPEEAVFFEHYGAYWGLHPLRGVRVRRRGADGVPGHRPRHPAQPEQAGQDWKYVRYYGPDDTEEMYDLRADPHELANLAEPARLAADPRLAAVRADLSERVEGWWRATGGLDFAAYESPEFKARGAATLQAPPGRRRGSGAAGAGD